MACSKELRKTISEVAGQIDGYEQRECTKEDVKALVIEPVLDALGWSTKNLDMVRREYHMHSGTPDYALLVDGTPCVLIEVKKIGNFKSAKGQVEKYCRDGKYVGVATDGRRWSVWRGGMSRPVEITDPGACEKLTNVISAETVRRHDRAQIKRRLGDVIKEFERKHGDEARDNYPETRECVRAFSRYIILYRNDLNDETNFGRVERAYANILAIYGGEKARLKRYLESLKIIDEEGIEKICQSPGCYLGVHRNPPRMLNAKVRNLFFDLIDGLMNDAKRDELYKMLNEFTTMRRSLGPALLTGIASATRPDEFMVYNQRSAAMLREIRNYQHLRQVSMAKYREFNNLYVQIAKHTGKTLSELDAIASYWWNSKRRA